VPEPWYDVAFRAHYLALYAHRDDAEAARCLALLEAAGLLAGRLLDLGCGDGRHLQALPQATGLDYSADLLAAARHRAPSAPLVRGDMRRLPFADGSFAAVLSLFTAFGYFGDDGDRRTAAEAARVLRPGGHWVLDLFDGDRVRSELGDGAEHVRERVAGPLAVHEARRFLAGEATVCKRVRLSAREGQAAAAAAAGVGGGGLGYEERVRVFTLGELEDLARCCGLVRVQAWGGYDGAPLGEGPRWILVYRKTGAGEATP